MRAMRFTGARLGIYETCNQMYVYTHIYIHTCIDACMYEIDIDKLEHIYTYTYNIDILSTGINVS